jgi:hypothetical protein
MAVHFRLSTKHLPTFSLMSLLILASLPSSGYSQSDSLFDCFPLSVGSQWEYKFTHFYQSDPNPTYYGVTDTGTVTYRVLRRWEYPDSVLWLFRQTRVLHRTVYDSWFSTLDSMVVDTTAFMLVELTADRHELFLQRAVYAEYPSDFGANLFNFGFAFWRDMPDSLRVYRYCPVDSTSTALFDFQWPRWTYPAIRKIELKKDVGAAFVRMQSMGTGSTIWSTFQLLSYHTIASSRDFYPLEVGNRWNYHLTYTEYYTIVDTGNVEIRVIGDTLMPNGRVYAHLSETGVLFSPFIRSDSDYVYYYSPWDSTEVAMYNVHDSAGTRDSTHWHGGGPFWSIVTSIDEYSILGVQRTQRTYSLGGLVWYDVSLADGIGLSGAANLGDGSPYVTTWTIRGAVIRGTVYGVVSGVAEDKKLPVTFELLQNYPNPFNPSTTIRFSLPHRSHATLSVYNTLGQQVAILVNQDLQAGYHEVRFDAGNLASGVYFYQLQAGTFVQTRKLCFVR